MSAPLAADLEAALRRLGHRPASIVHEHPDAELWLDREAAA